MMLQSACLSHTPPPMLFPASGPRSDSICTAPLFTGSQKHVQFVNSLLTCDHTFPSNLTLGPVNTRGAAAEKEGASDVQLSNSQSGGESQGVCVCAGSSPNVQESDMRSEKKGFSGVWRIFTSIGSTDAAVRQGDAGTHLGKGWGQSRPGDPGGLQVLGPTEGQGSRQGGS